MTIKTNTYIVNDAFNSLKDDIFDSIWTFKIHFKSKKFLIKVKKTNPFNVADMLIWESDH